MWCRHCQQDVPAVAQAAGSDVLCARCQRPFSDADAAAAEPVAVEPWKASDLIGAEDEERLREIGRQLRATQKLSAPHKPAERMFRADPPQPGPQVARPSITSSAISAPPRAASRPNQAMAWVVAVVGAVALGGGLGLLGWSLIGARPDLWNWGLAATLAGQGMIIVGLVQLLANLWTGNRDAVNRLISIHYEIRRLQRTADSLSGMKTATPSAFYADLARGSSPQVLMANLKGQLDELSTHAVGETA